MKVLFWAGSSTSSSAAEDHPGSRAELIDLVQHDDRVVRATSPERLDDPARQSADVGAAVAANLGLVAHAAERQANELAPERPGDALAKRGLADTRWTGEAEDRAAAVVLQAAHGQVVENAVLDLLEVVVVLVQNPLGPARLRSSSVEVDQGSSLSHSR